MLLYQQAVRVWLHSALQPQPQPRRFPKLRGLQAVLSGIWPLPRCWWRTSHTP